MISGIRIVCIPPSDATVANSTNKYLVLLDLGVDQFMRLIPREMEDTDTLSILWVVVTPYVQYLGSCDPVFLGIKS